MQFSKKALNCTQSPMRKFHPYAVEAEKRGIKIYHLNIGQPDIATPPAFFDAIANFSQEVLSYAPSPGMPVLNKAISDYYQKIGTDFTADEVLITTGGSEALQIACNVLLDEGDEIIIPEPGYSNYNTFVTITGGKIVPISTTPEQGYFYADRKLVESHIGPKTKAILLNNPGNPTGKVLSRAEMEMFVDIALKHDLFIICDEVYREFVYADEPLASFAQIKRGANNVIIADSVSKRFSACGARIGALLSHNKEFMAEALKFAQARLSVATLEQVAAAQLYSVGPEYFASVKEEYRKRRDTVVQKLKQIPGVIASCPEGAFYLMAALPVDDAEKFQQWLLEEFADNGETVMFAAGGGFYFTPGKGKNEVRIAYVLKQQDLERAMDLLALGIKAYNAR